MPNSKVTKLFHCKLSENAKMKWIRTTDPEKVSFSSTSRSSKFRSKQFLFNHKTIRKLTTRSKLKMKKLINVFSIEAKVCLKLNIKENYSMEFSNGFGKKHGESFVLFKKRREKFPIEMEQP